MGFDHYEIRHAFCDDSGSVSDGTKLKVAFDHVFQPLLQMNQVDTVKII
jgi:hypothetical protein